MAEPAGDPSLLFTPPKTPPDIDILKELGSTTAIIVGHCDNAQSEPANEVFVNVPVLSEEQKAPYLELPDGLSTDESLDHRNMEKIIGEYREAQLLHYYVRFTDGLAHKYRATEFAFKYPVIVESYMRDKSEGNLQTLDPTASYIHEKSRYRMIIKLNRKGSRHTAFPASHGGLSSYPGEEDWESSLTPMVEDDEQGDEDDEEEEDNHDDLDYDQEDSPIKPQRATRARTKATRNLPFSPKKTRSRQLRLGALSDDELAIVSHADDDDDDDDTVRPTRRSTRAKVNRKVNLAEDYNEDSDAYVNDGHRSTRNSKVNAQLKKKKPPRGKASRAAYGHFRSVADLDYDSYSDEETAPLRAHRDFCERCHREPAHALLKKPTQRGKKKKDPDDDLESGSDSEEKLAALGGWVRCLKCPVSAHWRCLAGNQRDEILKAARDRDRAFLSAKQAQSQPNGNAEADAAKGAVMKLEVPKRQGLDAYQITEFICGSCMKGGTCMGCLDVAVQADIGNHDQETGQVSKSEKVNLGSSREQNSSSVVPRESDVLDSGGAQGSATRGEENEGPQHEHASPHELLYRCFACKRLSHYEHLPPPPGGVEKSGYDVVERAQYYQEDTNWQCADCISFKYELDAILAWRPYPPNAIEPPLPANEVINIKQPLPREYLVKWVGRSYRRLQWVPHMWLLSKSSAKLRNFLTAGSKVPLLDEAVSEEVLKGTTEPSFPEESSGIAAFDVPTEAPTDFSHTEVVLTPSTSVPDAERKIPIPWKTPDRILDVLLFRPQDRASKHAKARKGSHNSKHKQAKGRKATESEEESDAEVTEQYNAVFEAGEQPSDDVTETVSDWMRRTGKTLSMKQIDKVVWAFIKWQDLGYDQTTWDCPPSAGELGYEGFKIAFQRYVDSFSVIVPKPTKERISRQDSREKDEFRRKYAFTHDQQPSIGQNDLLSLMPFQVDGVNWLCNNWWNHQHCILADDMGLGKTVQIVTFIGTVIDNWEGFPALVVVPNSTITNWVREFERWAPRLRVVPFYGEARAREIVKEFELYHEEPAANTTGAKYHVLVTTYDTITNAKEFGSVFKATPRWEILVVDEGQRLKADQSLLFKRLNELKTVHRIILTGTPLNNNIRELFNLMNFLDPEEWRDLEQLAKDYELLTEELIVQLHNRLRPYFLRRIKSEVLNLPPKNEVIVPISMAPLQKEIYRSILSQNLTLLKSLTQQSNAKSVSTTKTNMNNMLMQLRKCLQHPYLVSENIEPRNLSAQETQEKLISASAKIRFLKTLLPKLRERGHRVLLFSQFVIALNIVEDFLIGEGIKYLRLDGNTKQADRQKSMDNFNRPDSDIFIFLLTTRAGGVGINLFTADTVIIYDPDFNPHQDLQAIARAYRYGQQKTCLVFKLMIKDSAEERIMQTGKKKLVLDHLIVQKMDDEEGSGEDVQSILTFGAKALFEDQQESKDVVYTDHDIEKLIEKTETETAPVESDQGSGPVFSFAKVWSAQKDEMTDMVDAAPGHASEADAWAQTLERIEAERESLQVEEYTGRGARRRAAPAMPVQSFDFDETPVKETKQRKRKFRSKSKISEDSDAYPGSVGGVSDGETSSNAQDVVAEDVTMLVKTQNVISHSTSGEPHQSRPSHRPAVSAAQGQPPSRTSNLQRPPQTAPLSPIDNHTKRSGDRDKQICGLCGTRHGSEACYMTESSENLAEYRQILLMHAEDEPWEERWTAIQAIDETLYKRGKLHLIHGQPLILVDPRTSHPQSKQNNPAYGYSVPDQSSPFVPNGPPRVRAMDNTSQSHHVNRGHKSTGEVYDAPFMPSSLPIAGSSKRSHSPIATDLPRKKIKLTADASFCPVCRQIPHHLVKDCPIVLAGPARVSQAIIRLDQDPNMSETVKILRNILTKQKKHEISRSIGDYAVFGD